MGFIRGSAHHKFIERCDNFISDIYKNNTNLQQADESQLRLKVDIQQLRKIAETYKDLYDQLPSLNKDYQILQRSIMINMRRLRLKQKIDKLSPKMQLQINKTLNHKLVKK